MANFAPAYEKMINNEGGWSNLPLDRGGETYSGISRRSWPGWKGWEIIDAQPKKWQGKRFPIAELESLISSFYKKEFWDKMRGGDIDSQVVANFIFDWYIHSGVRALKDVQVTIGMNDKDGKIGPRTLAAINGMNTDVLMLWLIAARLHFVGAFILENPGQRMFLKGWKTRILSYANSF